MVTWVPVLAVVLVVWIFSSAIPRNLPVGVMDEDHSALSRQLVRMLNASPGMQVVDEFDSESSAQLALREVRVYGMINIPRDFERDIKRGIKAEVILRHNAQFATHSSLLQRDVRTVVGTLAAGIEMSARNKRGESAQQAKVSFKATLNKPMLQRPCFWPMSDYFAMRILMGFWRPFGPNRRPLRCAGASCALRGRTHAPSRPRAR